MNERYILLYLDRDSVQKTNVGRLLRRRRLNYCLLNEIWKLIIVPARRSLAAAAADERGADLPPDGGGHGNVAVVIVVAGGDGTVQKRRRRSGEQQQQQRIGSQLLKSTVIADVKHAPLVRRQTRVCIPRRRRPGR